MTMNDEELKSLQKEAAKITEIISRLTGERKEVTFGEYAKTYLGAKMENPTLRDSTKRSFELQTRRFLIPVFGSLPLDGVDNLVFLRWVNKTRLENETKSGPKLTRFFGARKTLIEILLAAKNDGLIEKLPKIDNPDSPKDSGRALTNKEVFLILKNTRSKFFRFFFYVLFKMGCRPQEVMRWEWSMFEWNEPGKTWISIPSRISKTDRSRKIPINPNVSKRLWKQYKQFSSSPFCFPKIDGSPGPQLLYAGAWRNMIHKTKLKCVPYDFRRTFVTRCAAENMPLIYVARALDTSVGLIEKVYAKAQVDIMENIVK